MTVNKYCSDDNNNNQAGNAVSSSLDKAVKQFLQLSPRLWTASSFKAVVPPYLVELKLNVLLLQSKVMKTGKVGYWYRLKSEGYPTRYTTRVRVYRRGMR